MPLLDDLKNTLQTRFTNNDPVFYASDLGDPGEQDFIDILGVDQLTFADPQLSEIQDGQLTISGATTVLGLESLPFDLIIAENENEQYGEYLVFTLIPQSPLPDTWEFSQSFPDLQASFFDNLVLSETYLIATSFDHAIPTPTISLSKGINFSATTEPERALKSLKSLCPSVSEIVLQGIITREGDTYGVNISASVADAPIAIPSPFPLYLKHIPAQEKENEQNIADFEGNISASKVNFPYTIAIPTTIDPLDELQRVLEARMENGNLEFRDTDLGEDVADDFFTSVGTHTVELTEASIVRQGQQLIVSGKASVFNLADDTPVQIIVVENEARLDFTLLPVSIPEDWEFSQSFPQLADSFFDQLQLSNVRIVATSYEHALESPAIDLVKGLNFYAETTSTGALTRLTELGNAFANTFPVQGTITQQDELYVISLSYPVAADLNLNLLGFEVVTIQQPILYLESIPGPENNVVSDSAYIRGTISMPPFAEFPGKLIVPVKDDQIYWELEKDTEFLDLPTITSLLDFYGQENLASVFPESFKILENITISELSILFLLADNSMGSVFTRVTLSPAADGTPRKWEILSSPRLAVSDLGFGLSVSYYTYDTDKKQMVFRCLLSGKITIGSTSNLRISLMIPLQGDWGLTVLPENVTLPTLSDIADFVWPGGGHSQDDLLAPLPQGLIQSGPAINISEIKTGFNPFTPSLSFISFLLEQTGVWSIISGVLEVNEWSVAMRVDVTEDVNIVGLLHGFITIGSGDNAIADIEANLPIPAGEQGWTLGLKEGTTIEIPSFGDLLALIGGQQFANGIPGNLAAIGGLTVSALEINFVPTPPGLNWFSFAMKSSEAWTLIDNILVIENVETNLDIRKGDDGQYNTSGVISGTVFVFNTLLWLMAEREDISQSWTLKLATLQSIHIPGLAELSAWMLPDSMLTYIPLSFMPFGQGFDLTDVNIAFDISSMSLQKIYFSIKNSEAWEVIPGYSYISVDNVVVQADIEKPFQDNQALTCHIEGTVNLGSFTITLQADKSTPEAKWILEGHLTEEAELDFEALFDEILPTTLPMPYDYGFPRSITITSASISLTPTTGELHFQAESTFNWQFNFAFITLNINSINAKLDLESANDEDNRLYIFNSGGDVTFCGLNITLTFRTSNTATEDTVLTAVVTPEQVQNISLPEISDTLTTTETTGDRWETLVPSDFTDLSFTQGYIHLNLSQNQFFLYGNISGFGTIVFLTKKLADETWGYLLALALGDNFAFANLFSGLSVIDDILTVNNAGLFLSSFEESSNDLISDIELVNSFPEKPGDFVLPLPIENLPEKQLQKGIYFYADLEFPATSLFGTILQIGDCATGLANVIISAFIATDNSVNTTFVADLPDITILNTIIFTHTNDYPGIHLEYTAKDEKQNEFKLIGRISLSLFGEMYSFDGSLVVDAEKIDSQLQLASDSANIEIPLPFGMPGIVFTDLYLGVKYTFATETTSTTCSFSVGGSVSFGEALSFSGKLQLNEITPVLATISLNHDLSIGQFFAQCVNAQWPENFIDITFLEGGKIYYYDESADPDGQFGTDESNYAYREGFNIDATIILTILIDISIKLTARVFPDNQGTYKGIIVDARLTDPIDLYVLQIAGTNRDVNGKYIAGPSLEINTVDDPASFGFAAGFNFFQEPFGMAGVRIQKRDGSDEMELLGHLEAAESIKPFNILSVHFTYSESQGFQINDWPDFELVSDVIDFIDEITELCDTSAGSPCGQLADFVTDVAFQTEFTISPSFSTKDDSLYFVLIGHYNLTVLHTSDPFVTVDFPELAFLLPNDLSLSALPGEIIDSIGNAAADFVKALLDNPEQIAMFLGILLGEVAANVALELVCNGLIDGLTASAAGAAGEAVAAAGGAAAAGAAAAAAAAAARALDNDDDGGNDDDDDDDDDDGGNDQPITPVFESLSYSNNRVTAGWQAACYASGYEFQLLNPSGDRYNNQSLELQTLTVNVPVDDNLPSGRCTGKVRSTRGDDKQSNWAEKTIDKLNIPSSITISFLDNKLHVSWNAVQAPAGNDEIIEYETRLLKDGEVIQSGQTQELSFAFDISDSGTYNAKVRATCGEICIPSNYGTSQESIIKHPAPTDVTFSYNKENEEFTITWTGVENSSGYTIEIVTTKENIAASIDVSETETSQTIPLADFTGSGGIYNARVTAKGEGAYINSDYALSAETIEKLPVPANITQSYDKAQNTLTATWDNLTSDNLANYELGIFDVSSQTQVGDCIEVPVPEGSPATVSQEIDISSFLADEAAEYQVKVQAIGNETSIDSDVGESQTTIIRLGMPQNITQTYIETNQNLEVQWETVQNATGYRIQVVDVNNENRVIAVKTGDASETPGCTFTREDFTEEPNSLYQVQVQAMGDEQVIDSASGTGEPIPIPVITLPELTLTFVNNETNGTIVASWTNDDQREILYDLKLLDAQGNQVGEIITGAIDSAEFTIENPQDNSSFTVQIGANLGEYNTDWSEGTGITIKLLTKPKNLNLTYEDNIVTATWDAVHGATGYKLLVLDDQGAVLDPQPEITICKNSAVIDIGILEVDATYQVQVKAVAENSESAWSEPVEVIQLEKPKLGIYASEDNNFMVQIDKANSKNGQINGVYKTNYSPEGPFTVKGQIGEFSWVNSERQGKEGVAPFSIRFASDRPEPGRSYCIYDTWTGVYQVNDTLLMEGSRSYVNSKGIVQTMKLGTLTFSQ